MATSDLEAGGLKRTLKDLFAGAAGGVAQVLLGQCQLHGVHVISLHAASTRNMHPLYCRAFHGSRVFMSSQSNSNERVFFVPYILLS